VNVTFPAYPDKVFSGKVLFVSDVIEPDTRATRSASPSTIRQDDEAQYVCEHDFRCASGRAVTVPTSALLMTNDKTSVFVEVAEWAFERRDVEVAYQEGPTAAVKAGLKPASASCQGSVRLND